MSGYDSYGFSQAERRGRSSKRQADNTLSISKAGHDAIVAARDALVASAPQVPNEPPMSVLNLPTDDRPAARFLICAAYLLESMEQLAGGAEASPLINGHCVNSTDSNAAFAWHVDNHAEAEGGEYIAHSLICLCSEGESSVVFVGAGEVTYPGVGGCVTFPSWVFHRTGRVVPTGRSMWKLARFGGVAIAKTRSGAEASIAGPRQAADSDDAAASMMQMAGGDARAVGVGAGERRR